MDYPVFVIDENDLDIFSSVESLSSYVEVYDAKDNRAFDANGNELLLRVKSHGRKLPYVIVEEPSEIVCESEFLAMRIKRYLQTVDESMNTSRCSLSELVALAVEVIGYS